MFIHWLFITYATTLVLPHMPNVVIAVVFMVGPYYSYLQSIECYDSIVQVQFVKDSGIVLSAFKC